METPILDFVRAYAASGVTRLHMPGHKGQPILGCEPWDITEVSGADALYEASGIIAKSEAEAARLFGTGATFYSTEGSSQCVKAMMHLALTCRAKQCSTAIVAARNVHKSFVHGAALLDVEPIWLWPEAADSLCSCIITPQRLAQALSALPQPPAAVYVTSPDYLGRQQDIRGLSQVCHSHGTRLLVDNAHGAYLHFLPEPAHPMDLGADLCCDSAHKTLPALTGGAYLHLARALPAQFRQQAKLALSLFGSTSPSYLTLASLDGCNAYLSDGYCQKLEETVARIAALRQSLRARGLAALETEPLKLTLDCAASSLSGTAAAQLLRDGGVECEFADAQFLVCMFTPENPEADYQRLEQALSQLPPAQAVIKPAKPPIQPERVLSPRQALLSRQELVPSDRAVGRICGTPTVACPPAVPIVVSGERIDRTAADQLRACGIERVSVVAE